jgi:hypothetical protein
LTRRFLHGVIARHNVSIAKSLEVVQHAQAEMKEGGQSTYIYVDRNSIEAVGAGSIMPDLELRRQLTPLPVFLSRRLPILRGEVQLMDKLGPNVTAWIDPTQYREEGRAALALAYKTLAETVRGPAWTIEPSQYFNKDNVIVPIMSSECYSYGGEGYYDDQESRRHWLPNSWLLVANYDPPVLPPAPFN